ncbi:MAG: helicase-related protein [Acinetobacter sp.]
MSKITPYPFQERAINAAVAWMKRNTEPCLLDLSMSSGKSVMAAFIAKELVNLAPDKKVLILCPSASLVRQNAEKVKEIYGEVSVFSSSIRKELRSNIVVATPQTFISIAAETDHKFSCVIIDEGEGLTKAVKETVLALREKNPLLRECGMTGTPYRTGEGYVYEIDERGNVVEEAYKPYYKKSVARVSPHELIELGLATPPKVIDTSIRYETQNIELTKSGKLRQADIDAAFIGHDTKTSAIVHEIVNYSNELKFRGVIIFAASIDHCKEIMASLPAYNSAMIHGENSAAENKRIIDAFRAQKIRYLVNVNMATVGLSVDHVDFLAILRLTESSRLYQQMLGRGMRLDKLKDCFYVADYTDNIEKLFPSGDVFSPDITGRGDKAKIKYDFICPTCSNINNFTLRPNPDQMNFDNHGYALNLDGERLDPPFPMHYGRRCLHVEEKGRNNFERCTYFWECKMCECGQDNDIAARKCSACKALLIDYNDKLVGKFLDFKNDLSQVQTDSIEWFSKKEMASKAGNNMLRVTFNTKYRKFVAFFSSKVNKRFYEMMMDVNFRPKTVSYKKSSKTEFFTVVDFDRAEDVQA